MSIVLDGRTVLVDVDLTVPDGEVTALLGASGSGKTSLLRTVAGVLSPTSGRIAFGGRDVTAQRPDERGLAYVPQGAPLLPDRDVSGNVAFPLQVRGADRASARGDAEDHARWFGIGRLLDRLPGSLSRGEQAAAGIARGLVRPPNALLLDEPVPHLDPRLKGSVLARIAAYQELYATTVLLATNDVHVVEVLADRVAVIDRATVVRVGPLEEVRDDPGTVLVADLVSPTPLRWLPGVLRPGPRPGESTVDVGAGEVVSDHRRLRGRSGPVLLGLGGRDGVLAEAGTGSLSGRVTRIATTGPRRLVTVATGSGDLVVDTDDTAFLPAVHEPVDIDVRRAHVADPAGDVIAVLS